MIQKQIKAYTTRICLQEIPDEISLTYFISNCPNNCPGCHSPHLRQDIGVLVKDILPKDLQRQLGRASCVLFMGGDDPAQAQSLLQALQICRAHGFKTALYSGFQLSQFNWSLIGYLDYLKVGPYKQECGGLSSHTTNQRLYEITQQGSYLADITNKFWRSLDRDADKN